MWPCGFWTSVAIVEHQAGARRLYYMVTIVSNVLRRNSASVHMELATRLPAARRGVVEAVAGRSEDVEERLLSHLREHRARAGVARAADHAVEGGERRLVEDELPPLGLHEGPEEARGRGAGLRRRRTGQRPSHHASLTMKTSSAGAEKRSPRSRTKSVSPGLAPFCRLCVHTT